MNRSTNYKDLIVWQKAIDLATWIYSHTAGFPKEEIYGIVSQMRRAAVSVPSNIAEGQSRQHKTEFIQFLSIVKGSLAELETQLIISAKLKYIGDREFDEGTERIDALSKGNRMKQDIQGAYPGWNVIFLSLSEKHTLKCSNTPLRPSKLNPTPSLSEKPTGTFNSTPP